MKYYYDIEKCETILEEEQKDVDIDTILVYLISFIMFCFVIFIMMNSHDIEVKNLRDFCLA